MTSRRAKNILASAAEKCHQSGSKLTSKRAEILKILVDAKVPLSAYEVTDRYNAGAEKSMPPMSAYRILDFLISEQLAHKLASDNKYIACSHIACNHEHQVPQFLICRQCHSVKEIAIDREIIEKLGQHVSKAGFQLANTQLELDCICDDCAKSAA